MKSFIILLIFGLFAMVVSATPAFDTSPSGCAIGMPEGTVTVIAVSDYSQPALTLAEGIPLPDIRPVEQLSPANYIKADAAFEAPDLRTDERLCFTFYNSTTPDLNIINPSYYLDRVITIKLPLVKQLHVYSVHSPCTIRTWQEVTRKV